LHWTTVGLIWDCGGGLYRENEPLRNLRQRPQTFPGAQRDALTNQIMHLPKEEALGFAWCALLELYSEMKLTVGSDCLTAIHGIASRLSLQHDEEYLGGLFKTYCAQGLVWKRAAWSEAEGLIQGFPSWSWASSGSWSFHYLRLGNVNHSSFTSWARWVESERHPLLDDIPNFSDRSMRRIRVEAPLVILKS
jgi:hypothetical protein